MDADQNLLDAGDAREEAYQIAEWKLKQQLKLWYEGAAKEAHKIRQINRLLRSGDSRAWDELPLGSQRHLMADAENVAANQNITVAELHGLYQARLIAWGDSDNEDLMGPLTEKDYETENRVLSRLKEYLARISPATPVEPVNG